MKLLYKCLLAVLLLLVCGKNMLAHSVQVGYCVSCTGELTLYVEHWHNNEDPSTTTMTIQLNINGVISTSTGSPVSNIQNTAIADLPGCNDPIHIFASCPSYANTYNDWVVFKFPNLPCGVPVVITVNSGNTVFTEDGCGMYPASSPVITVPCTNHPPPVAADDATLCTGDSASIVLTGYINAIQWQSASTTAGPWTDIPGATSSPFSTGPLTGTTSFRALEDQGCASNPVTITINTKPISDAGTDIVSCISNTPGQIGVPSTPGYTYSWSPTTGLSSSTAPRPTVSLLTPDTIMYVVTTTLQSCSSQDSVLVIVKPDPVSNAGSDVSVCTSQSPSSIGSASTSGYTYSWSPATNLSSTSVSNPSVTVTNPGTTTYIVSTTSNGCTSTDTVDVEVNPLPQAGFSIADVCQNETSIALGSSSVSAGFIADSIFDYGDNTPLTADTAHVYASSGTYSVTLMVTTDKGCMDTLVKNTTVHPNPVADFTFINACDGSPIQYTNISTIDSPDNIQTYHWDFGDTATLATQNVQGGHLYSGAGTYNTLLKVISNFGCTDSVVNPVVVNPNPVVDFVSAITSGCDPLCINFQDMSNIATGANVQWVLDYGDNSGSSSQDLSHCYNNSSALVLQQFSPTLTVTSDSGCVSILTKTDYITVFPNPIAQFTIDPTSTTIVTPLISFFNTSVGADIWNWNFGDNDTSMVQNPIPHEYADTGTYLITLITSTQYGCFDTAYQTITIDPDFVFYVPNAFSPNGDGHNDTFTGKGVLVQDFEMTIFDRWGNEIFYTNDLDIPWDGKANDGKKAAQIDVYIYQITVKDIRQKKHNYSGIVSLVR